MKVSLVCICSNSTSSKRNNAEAFVGILYGSFISAIIFAKVKRITQRAQVSRAPESLRFQMNNGLLRYQIM